MSSVRRAIERLDERRAACQNSALSFGAAKIVRAHDGVDEPVDAGLLGFHGERIAVSIRDEPKAFTASAHARKELRRTGREIGCARDARCFNALRSRPRSRAPVIETVPLERADLRLEPRRQRLLRRRRAQAVQAPHSDPARPRARRNVSKLRSSRVPSMSTSTVSIYIPIDDARGCRLS